MRDGNISLAFFHNHKSWEFFIYFRVVPWRFIYSYIVPTYICIYIDPMQLLSRIVSLFIVSLSYNYLIFEIN